MDPSTDRAASSPASEAEAAELLARPHAAQNDFYAGGGDAALRAVLSPDISWHVPGHKGWDRNTPETCRGLV